MSEAERLNLDSVLAFHGAATLLGVKCANLISFDRNEFTMSEYLSEFAEKLTDCGLCAKQRASAVRERLSTFTMRKCLMRG